MNEILVEQPKEEFNYKKNISNFRIYNLGFTVFQENKFL